MSSWIWVWTDTTSIDWIVNLAVKSSLVIFVALSLSRLLRNGSARLRYKKWKVVFLILALLPFIGLLPSLLVHFQPAGPTSTTIETKLPVPYEKTASPVNTVRPGDSSLERQQQTSNKSALPGSNPIYWLLSIWIVGILLYLTYLFTELIFLKRTVRKGRECRSAVWIEELKLSKRLLGIEKSVSLIISGHVKVPFTYGWRQARIVLPGEAESWDRSKIRTVLLHELAHIQKGDFVFNLFKHLIKACYWWNPFVWYMAKSSRLDCESSCDELVVESGVSHIEYAEQLVDIARLVNSPRANALSISVASEPELKKRVSCILRYPETIKAKASLIALRAVFGAGLVLVLFNVSVDSLNPKKNNERLLVKLTNNSDSKVAAKAIRNLGMMRNRSAVESLVKALKHDNPEVKSAAAWALGQINYSEAVGKILPLVDHENDMVKEQALLSLGEYGYSRLFYKVAKYHNDPNPEIRKATMWSLHQIGCFPAFSYISKHVADDDPRVSKLAKNLLSTFPKDKLRSWIVKHYETETLAHSSYVRVRRAGTDPMLVSRLSENEKERKLMREVFNTSDPVDAMRQLADLIR